MPDFYLTRRAMLDLLEIEEYSIQKWGESQTNEYLAEIYESFQKIAQNPEIGILRSERSFPFLMAPAGKHFAVYIEDDRGIIIATVLHGRRNIENIIEQIAPLLAREINALKGQ